MTTTDRKEMAARIFFGIAIFLALLIAFLGPP